MAVVDDKSGFAMGHDVESAGIVLPIGTECFQAGADGFLGQPQRPRRRGCRQGVLYLEGSAPRAGDGDLIDRDEVGFRRSFAQNQLTVAHEDHALALAAMLLQRRMRAVEGKEDHRACAQRRHLRHQRIARIEHSTAGGQDHVHQRALDREHVVDGVHVVQSEVVSLADVGHHRHVAAVEAKTLAQDPTAGRFEYRSLDLRVE